MALRKRILQAEFDMGGAKVLLDESLQMRIRIHKDALMIQAQCSIEIFNLTRSMRAQLLSQFTEFNKKLYELGSADPGGPNNPYVNVTITAGYVEADGKAKSSVIFIGQVVEAVPGSYPPNLSVRIDCASQQLDRLKLSTGSQKYDITFEEFVRWAGEMMGVSETICETSMNSSRVWNQSNQTHSVAQLLIEIQDAYKPNVVAFIDNNRLIVRDANKVISSANQVTIEEFIGTPMWTAYGAQFETLFNPLVTLTSLATLQSRMNPSLNGDYVLISLDYDLSTRDTQFYVKGSGCPPAAAA